MQTTEISVNEQLKVADLKNIEDQKSDLNISTKIFPDKQQNNTKMIPEIPNTLSESEDDFENEKYLPVESELRSFESQHNNDSLTTWLQKIAQMQNEIQKKLLVTKTNDTVAKHHSAPTQQNSSRIVKYQDLPYMGEMTLDNCRPRRGRKPKKADICHLIYKNYGTIFPGTPNVKSILDKDIPKKSHTNSKLEPVESSNRSNVQNKIISSLLEKRLTQENKRQKKMEDLQNEPLNLCKRDLIKQDIKSEPLSDEDIEYDVPSPSTSTSTKTTQNVCTPPLLPLDATKMTENDASAGYVYWPNAGIFIHPMAFQQQLLYYQKIAAGNNANTEQENAPENKISELRKIIPKQVKPKSEENHESDSTKDNKLKRSSSCEKSGTKRKRSAIFIPPIPTESQNNPATEVSICKFKFTGGAKPSLQEKKMLSVDSGGNFRYYSGTGDKSMRGYEFFPRETLQQQVHNSQGSSTGAFLQASGEKIYPHPPIEFSNNNKVNDFMLSPELHPQVSPTEDITQRSKKRKSRKSLQREKLEQTFKEKGFLIQTQQLESAEGATYCKFRQLRKFTRYLFRSWKDYLPGNVAENGSPPEKVELEDIENASTISSPNLESDRSTPV